MKFVNHHVGCCGFSPVRPDGSEWPHVLGLPGGASVHADTPAEILGELIEGYERLDVPARRAARVAHAARVATQHQEVRINQAVAEGSISPGDPQDTALIEALRAAAGRSLRLSRPDSVGEGSEGEQAPAWEGAVRLVCVSTSYAPHTDVPAPTGRVDWLDPTDEQRYLISLRRIGAADYWCEGWDAEPAPHPGAASSV